MIFSLIYEAGQTLNSSACGQVSLIGFPWAQLEIQTQNNWRRCWACPQVPVGRGDTWRWLFNMCLVPLFWGFIGRESHLYGRKPHPLGVLFSRWEIFGAAFLSAGFHSRLVEVIDSTLAYWQIVLFPSLHRRLWPWPSEHLPRMCQVMNELYLRLCLKATALHSGKLQNVSTQSSRGFQLAGASVSTLQLLWAAWSAMLWLLIFINL